MTNLISSQFHAALNHLLRQKGRGAQTRLAIEQNIDRGYLNAIIKGRKPGAEDIRTKIATHFGMAYEDMLVLGRRIIEGGGDLEPKDETAQEALPPAEPLKNERNVFELHASQEDRNRGANIPGKILKVLEILESNTNYSDSLSGVIDTYHQAIGMNRENQTLQDRLKGIEGRLAQLEKLLPY